MEVHAAALAARLTAHYDEHADDKLKARREKKDPTLLKTATLIVKATNPKFVKIIDKSITKESNDVSPNIRAGLDANPSTWDSANSVIITAQVVS